MDFTLPVDAFLSGFPNFLLQLAAAFAIYAAALASYTAMSPHKELQLVRSGNPSASLALGGVVVGLAIPLGACLTHAFGAIDLIVWGVIVMLIQILAFRFTDMILKDLPKRIAEGDVAAAVYLMSVKLALALIVSGAISDPSLSMFRRAMAPGVIGFG